MSKTIEFKNGSAIECLDVEEGSFIRGKRRQLPLFYDDFEYDKDEINEVLEVYINNKPQSDYILGMDIASKDSKDFSCVTMMCVNCRTIIDSKPFTGNQPEGFEVPDNCPQCGVELGRCIIRKEK